MFKNLIIERRIIIVAESLSTLSSCVASINSLTYPFTWHHIYIPVLPLCLIDYCTAPMPFMVGILKVHLKHLESMPLEEVVVLDLDNDSFLTKNIKYSFPPTYEVSFKRSLKSLIKLGPSYFSDPQNEVHPSIDRSKGFEICFTSIFQQFFFKVFDGYQDFFNTKSRFDPVAYADTKESSIKKVIFSVFLNFFFKFFLNFFSLWRNFLCVKCLKCL